MGLFRGLLSFLGRIMVCAVFVTTVCMQLIPNFDESVAELTDANVPNPKFALIGAIVLVLLGSFCVITGYAGRFGALLLLISLAAATYYFHPFWEHAEGTPEFAEHLELFLKHLAIGGALVLLLANGTSGWSSHMADEEEGYDYP